MGVLKNMKHWKRDLYRYFRWIGIVLNFTLFINIFASFIDSSPLFKIIALTMLMVVMAFNFRYLNLE